MALMNMLILWEQQITFITVSLRWTSSPSPPLWEGLPNILLEAMALGRPVIASKIEGISEVVTDNETALLFNPGNETELSNAILRLISDKDLTQKIGANDKKTCY